MSKEIETANKGMQAYVTSVETKTGMKLAALIKIVRAKGFAKPGEATAWLKTEYGLGHGHANFAALLALKPESFTASDDDQLASKFKGEKEKWRKPYDAFAAKIAKFGSDVKIAPNNTYINLQRGGKKFGIVQISAADRVDVGIKNKNAVTGGRVEAAGSWNAMVTHRVRVADAKQLDAELLGWLKQAYEAAA